MEPIIDDINRKMTTALKIANTLRQEIYKSNLKAGFHLNENTLALEFGTSRGPVRDAIKLLESEGIVNTPPNGRTVVLGFTVSEIDDYYNLRYFLESESIKKILSSPEDDSYYTWVSEVEEILQKSKLYLQNDNEEDKFKTLDYKFHLSILNKADKKLFTQIWKTLANMSLTIMETNKKYLSNRYFDDIVSTFEYHDRIFTGIKNRDLSLALENLDIHLKKGSETFARIIKSLNKL